MQSRNAYILGSFVIPEGATSGPRIEFDAENGFIRVYGPTGQLTNTIGYDPATFLYGFVSYPTGGRTIAEYQSDGIYLIPDPTYPIAGNVFTAGLIRWINPGTNDALPGYTEWLAPRVKFADNYVGMQALNRSRDNTKLPHLRFGSSEDTDPATFQFAGTIYAATGELGAPDVVSWVREDWTNLTMANGWVADVETPQYKKMADGTVLLRGNMTGGVTANGTTIANLPAGYRPTAQQRFITAEKQTGLSYRHVAISSAGVMTVWNCTTAHICLDGVRFPIV